jgi:hypothetical protein
MVSSEWRIVFLEGSAPALPKNFVASGVVWMVGFLPNRLKNFLGTTGAVPSNFSPNEFSAQGGPSPTSD